MNDDVCGRQSESRVDDEDLRLSRLGADRTRGPITLPAIRETINR